MLDIEFIGKIVECHIDINDPETFVVGEMIFFDSTYFVLLELTPTGRWNGVAIYLTEDIVTICDDTKYLRKIKDLVKKRNLDKPIVPKIFKTPIETILKYASLQKKIVCLELCKSGYRDIYGRIVNIYDEILCMDEIDEFGYYDGKSFIDIKKITRLFFNDEETECLELLLENDRGNMKNL